MRTRILVVLFMFLASVLSAQTESASPRTVPPSAPPASDASFSQLSDWLTRNPGHAAAAQVFAQLLDSAETVKDLETIRTEVLPRLQNREIRAQASADLAAIYRTARRLEQAADLFNRAYELSGGTDLVTLFAHAQILFELGEFRDADSEARVVVLKTSDYSLKRRAYTLSARVAYEEGKVGESLEMLETLASLAEDSAAAADLVEVETLLLLRQIVETTGDEAKAQRAKDLLAKLFPDSIAAEISTGPSRTLALPGLPSSLLLAQQGESDADSVNAATPEAAGRRDQPRLSAVQVGSFSDEDNANHLVADLRRLGLDAESDAISREGTTLHQVIVRIPGGSPQSAARVLATLRENGFDGFMVY